MTIALQTSRVDYVGNGNTAEYDYTFQIFSASDLLVSVRDANNIETTLTLNTDYTVSGAGDPGGGSITLAAGNLESGNILTIRRVRDLTQETDIRNQGEFFPETHEDTFDHLIMVDQQQQDEIDRSLKLPETVASAGFDATLPTDISSIPGGVVVVNAGGDGFDIVPPELAGTLDSQLVGDLELLSDGSGIVMRTPDGIHTYRGRIDNDGNFITEQLT